MIRLRVRCHCERRFEIWKQGSETFLMSAKAVDVNATGVGHGLLEVLLIVLIAG